MKKQAVALASCSLLIGASILTGCGTPTSEASGHGPVTITWESISFGNVGARKTIVKLFEKTHPSIKVSIMNAPSAANDYESRLITQIGGGATTPDVYMMDDIWPATFGSKGLALNLSKNLPEATLNQVPKTLLKLSGEYNGAVYGLPFWTDSGFLYYRKDLLAKYHLPIPKTLAQLQREAKYLVSQHAVKYGYVYQGADYLGNVCDFMEILADFGGQLLHPNGTAAVDSAAGQHALGYLRGLITSGASPAIVTTYEESQSLDTFAAGNAAFMRNWSYAYAASQATGSKVSGNIGIEPMPGNNAFPGYSAIGGWDLGINPNSKNLKAALTFVQWNLSNQAQNAWAHYITTANPEPASVPSLVKDNPVLLAHKAVKLTSCAPGVANYAQLTQVMYSQINLALAGTESISTALKNMASGINSLHLGPSAYQLQGTPPHSN